MKNANQIMALELPNAEAADLTVRAAQFGVATPIYLGMLVLSAAYGVNHPLVAGFNKRPKAGQFGPKTQQ